MVTIHVSVKARDITSYYNKNETPISINSLLIIVYLCVSQLYMQVAN
jgi:hypothetical protein